MWRAIGPFTFENEVGQIHECVPGKCTLRVATLRGSACPISLRVYGARVAVTLYDEVVAERDDVVGAEPAPAPTAARRRAPVVEKRNVDTELMDLAKRLLAGYTDHRILFEAAVANAIRERPAGPPLSESEIVTIRRRAAASAAKKTVTTEDLVCMVRETKRMMEFVGHTDATPIQIMLGLFDLAKSPKGLTSNGRIVVPHHAKLAVGLPNSREYTSKYDIAPKSATTGINAIQKAYRSRMNSAPETMLIVDFAPAARIKSAKVRCECAEWRLPS